MTQNPGGGSHEEKLSLTYLQEIDWKRYEILCRDYFQAKGFQARLTDVGADGGVDVILSRFNDKGKAVTVYVQCKAWSQQKVGVQAVRELYGVMAADKVPIGIFMATSDFTNDAKAFAEDKKLQLISGQRFIELIGKLPTEMQEQLSKTALSGDYRTPTCPSCDVKMVIRTTSKGKNSGVKFWGCRNYPKCKHKFFKKSAEQEPTTSFSWEYLGGASNKRKTEDSDQSGHPDEEPLRADSGSRRKAAFQAKAKLLSVAISLVGIWILYSVVTSVFTSMGESMVSRTKQVQEKQQKQLVEAQQQKVIEQRRLDESVRARELLVQERKRGEAVRLAEKNRLIVEGMERKQKLLREKDKAFNSWYSHPLQCEGRRANDNMVECVSLRKKAKLEFEKIWSEGKIEHDGTK
ncbi:hypothetical protein ACH42_03215 [Endozoicomonas sp. (ex Bugula neritina AB1)]|nr:hypothetical protein ACH42_03215 [Endozoicomonas sp. (ex Bugula neritina AB1)]